jgi:hypothetical protein
MKEKEIERIEVFNLCPGCPPEYLRELTRTITSPSEINRAVRNLAVAEEEQNRPERLAMDQPDGGRAVEYRIHYSDGEVVRHIVRGALAEDLS